MEPIGELSSLRQLLDSLTGGSAMIFQNGADVTQSEIDKLKPDIEYLERLLAPNQEEAMSWLV